MGDYEIYNDMLYVGKRLYIPDAGDIRTKILQMIHKTPPCRYVG